MGIVMNMSSYEVERIGASETEYGDEVLSSGWNPVVALACQQHSTAQCESTHSIPASVAMVDVESFLHKMYAYQR
jgi:hypothetical protein